MSGSKMDTWWICLLHVIDVGPQHCKTFSLPTSFWRSLPNPCHVVSWLDAHLYFSLRCHSGKSYTWDKVSRGIWGRPGAAFTQRGSRWLPTPLFHTSVAISALARISNQMTQVRGSNSGSKWALHLPQPCLQKSCQPCSCWDPTSQDESCFQPCCPCCLGKEDTILQHLVPSSTTTVVLKANVFSFLFLRWCFGVCFFLIFKRHSFMLNCIEIIFLSQHHQSPSLSWRFASEKLLVPCLLIFSFRNQQEDRQKLSPQRQEHNQEWGAWWGPLKMPSVSIQNITFLF